MWEIDLSRAEKSELSALLHSMAVEQAEGARADEARVQARLDELREQSIELERAGDAASNQYARSKSVLAEAETRLQLLRLRHSEDEQAFREAGDKATGNSSARRKALFELDQAKVKANAAGAYLADSGRADQGATVLCSMLENIDTSYPLRIDDTVPSVTWRTRDIHINDGFGGKIPTSFGSYVIDVRWVVSSIGISSVRVVCTLDGVSQSGLSSYPHPHISGTNPCLGNASELLSKMMAEKDYVGIIVVMTEFLVSYNHENPYVKLKAMGVPNRWEYPVCETGRHLMSSCDCLRCPSCGGIKQPQQMSDCGVCTSCCVHHHFYDVGVRLQRSGINGTGCTHRAVPRVQYKKETTNESDRQENADIHQDGLGQDVGDDVEVPG